MHACTCIRCHAHPQAHAGTLTIKSFVYMGRSQVKCHWFCFVLNVSVLGWLDNLLAQLMDVNGVLSDVHHKVSTCSICGRLKSLLKNTVVLSATIT